jgi:putative oxidoreductase
MINVFFLGRIILGLYFIYSGYNHFINLDALAAHAASKKVPQPKASVFVTGLILFIGGATIVTGIAMFIGVWALIVFLLAVSFLIHPYWKIKDPMEKMAEEINFTKNIALVGALLIIVSQI